MVPEREAVVDAALNLIDATLGIRVSESLKHEKHAKKLVPLRRLAKELFAGYFQTQKKALLRVIKPRLEEMAALMESEAMVYPNRWVLTSPTSITIIHEADDKADKAAVDALPDGLLPWVITDALRADYAKILEGTLKAGYNVLATDLDIVGSVKDDAVAAWLRDHSLEKLTGGLDETTVERLRNALADAYREGADFDGLVRTVTDTYADFADSRAETIAQTELNSAYNAGRHALGVDLGFNEKSWALESLNPCPVCIENALEGWIPIDEPFPSGDMLAVAHPSCYCSNDFRNNLDA